MIQCQYCFEEYDESMASGVCPFCGYHEGFQAKDPRYLPLGTVVHGRYLVGGVIGDGGFGITYRVWDQVLGVRMAMKEFFQRGVVNREPGTTQVFISAPNRADQFEYGKTRLLDESRVLAGFQSAGIVRVNDFFEENGTSYMVMAFLDSTTLSGHLKNRKRALEPEEVRDIGIQVCEALAEIHTAGVIHRDIAPDNIFWGDDGQTKMIDFGTARLANDDAMDQLIIVKEGFSPIEQYEPLDPKTNSQQGFTDIYALGATLYYCATGVRPTESRIRKNNVDSGQPDIKEPMELNPAIPENLNNAIMRAMAINPHERFQTAKEFRDALDEHASVPTLQHIRSRKRRRRVIGIAAAIAVILAVVLVAVFYGRTAYDDVALDAADITVWFPDTVSETVTWDSDSPASLDGAPKTAALAAVIQSEKESTQFDQVRIVLTAYPASEYDEALRAAYDSGTMPTLFECVDDSAPYMDGVYDVSGIIANLDSGTRDCLFLKQYRDLFEASGCIPLGFTVPMVYSNPQVLTVSISEASSMEELLALDNGEVRYKGVAVEPAAEPLFRDTLSDYDSISSANTATREQFLAGEAALYLATSSELEAVSETVPSLITLTGDVACRFQDFWSISSCPENQRMAAEVLLAYLYTSYAQDQYYLREGASDALPLNTTVLEQYGKVHPRLQTVIDNTGSCQFSWYALAS